MELRDHKQIAPIVLMALLGQSKAVELRNKRQQTLAQTEPYPTTMPTAEEMNYILGPLGGGVATPEEEIEEGGSQGDEVEEFQGDEAEEGEGQGEEEGEEEGGEAEDLSLEVGSGLEDEGASLADRIGIL
jgi:hypothetical protein